MNITLREMLKEIGIILVIVFIGIICSTAIIMQLEYHFEKRNIKTIPRETFEEERILQANEMELYVILPEKYGNETIDNYMEELGDKYNYNLISIEFKYNHVIYRYRKNEFIKGEVKHDSK